MTSDRNNSKTPETPQWACPQWVEALSEAEEVESIIEDLLMDRKDVRAAAQRKEVKALKEGARQWSDRQAFQAFRGVACSIAANLDLKSLIKQILDAAIQTLGAERGILFLGRGQESGLVPVVALNVKGEELDELQQISRTILRRGQAGEVLISQDATNDPRFQDIPSVPLKDIHSVLCAPLVSRGKSVGVIYLDAPSTSWVLSQEVGRFLEALAGLAAVALENARLYGDVKHENSRLRRRMSREPFEQLVTLSPRMNALLEKAAAVARVDAPILLQGESGTGKELLARSIHKASPRALNPFVAYNCAAVPKELMESLFFGHVKGAFTGAQRDVPGLFREADRGVLFLDEIADLEPELQAKLLRTLEDGLVRPVGGRREFHVDVRLITATSSNIRLEMQENRFRKELYHRINVLDLYIPPLRERPEDIPALVDHFLRKHLGDQSSPYGVVFAQDAQEFLQTLPWPGNVRELENLVRRVLVLSNRPVVDGAWLKRFVSTSSEKKAERPNGAFEPSPARIQVTGRIRSMAEREREAIREALVHTGGNKSEAARILGLHRNTMVRKMQQLHIFWKT